MKNKNFIIFSSIDWSTHWQIHHQLVESIKGSGGKVLFVENTGVRTPKIRDVGRIIDRIKSRISSVHGFKSISKEVTIYIPLFIPYPYSRLSIFINTLFITRAIKQWVKVVNFYNPVSISFLPTPTIQEVISQINSSLVVYYCADDMSRSLVNTEKFIKYEKKFFKEADLVLTTSHKMYHSASQFSNFVYNIPAGVDSKKFFQKDVRPVPKDIKHILHPIIGYIGAISDVFDKDLVVQMAAALPDVSILIVGPKHTDISILENVKNIIFIGEKEHNLITDYISSFDIAMIPYVVNQGTNSVYSCKLNEYLSLGKAVLSTNLDEVIVFNEENDYLVSIGVNVEDFIQKAKKLLKFLPEEKERERVKRINVAKKNTWNKRFAEIDSVIDYHLELKLKDEDKNWVKKLISMHKKSKYMLINRLTIIFMFYFFIFYSPFFWFIGERLVVYGFPEKSDAIVVFSGDGEISYKNLSYQKRTLESIRLYKEGYADKIFLSSGREQTIADVEMIRLYLVNRGVPESSIYILDKYPNSTYQNVKMVKDKLDKNNINSVLFLTSPYHSLRSMLLWKKNAPDKRIISYVKKLPNNSWNIGFDKIRVIAYEYTSIIYNWIIGRI